ncbi:DUF4386 domain-containing protein [Paenibacillus pinistramenti]|uniref:DUF4386 domain-containing protein n=1 Tax=Paenibacillus pinistramenti TaxID=1768003 RepID=UPI001108200A|nr:DUF4386 domain-containing protein [Paenibacillus pinistramenti]
MSKDRINGVMLGLFYIAAAVTSVIAVLFYQPVLSGHWYTAAADGFKAKVLLGVVNELLLVVSAVGTAVMLFPYVRRWNEHIALGYLCFRFMEAVFIAIGLVSILGLLHLSTEYQAGRLTDPAERDALGGLLQAVYRWTSVLGPNLMLGINTTLYSYLLYRMRGIPRLQAVFGMVTAVMVFIAGLLELFGAVDSYSAVKGLLALPVGVYEMSLAVYFIGKGFRKQKALLLQV